MCKSMDRIEERSASLTFASQLTTELSSPSDPPPGAVVLAVVSKNCPQNSSNRVKYTLRLAAFSLASLVVVVDDVGLL